MKNLGANCHHHTNKSCYFKNQVHHQIEHDNNIINISVNKIMITFNQMQVNNELFGYHISDVIRDI